jgi:hypothetical protein
MAQAARGLSALAVVCSVVAGAYAQTPSRAADARTREIYVSVLDNKGMPVGGLSPADLVVKEDNVVREVLDVKPADAPMQIAVLIDDSTAATDATSYLRDGLAAFLERMRGRAEIGLITVGDRPTVLAPYTTDTEVLNKQVRRIFPRTNSGAYLLDAIVDASKALAKREATRPVILAITFEGVEHSNVHHDTVLKELARRRHPADRRTSRSGAGQLRHSRQTQAGGRRAPESVRRDLWPPRQTDSTGEDHSHDDTAKRHRPCPHARDRELTFWGGLCVPLSG